ncbi:hypothetical protein KRP22_007172 [Phytophthora ramorum]|nr:hypothetical protein KRP22_1731 [Phytophthora ramorum]
MSRLAPKAATEVVTLSYWAFVVWWFIILNVHAVTGVYNALYAYCYWVLKDTYLNNYLDSFQIGMPPPYHHTIAVVHVAMSALHALCIVLMVGGSIWQRSLAFTPWASCSSSGNSAGKKPDRTNAIVMQTFSKIYVAISDRRGLCGVNGDHFHAILVCREMLETALQTVQAYRMSTLLPRTLLNRFYVLLLAVNCWSSAVIYSTVLKGDEARRRFVCIVLDCVLDLVACMGVELIILLSYVNDYTPEIRGFWDFLWHNDEWAARTLNEFRMVVVVSWSDLASRAIFSLGLVMTTTNMKELLQRLPKRANRVTQSTYSDGQRATITQASQDKLNTVVPGETEPSVDDKVPDSRLLKHHGTNARGRARRVMLRAVHLLFGVWGVAVIGLHTHASLQPTLPQCLMQVRPWAVSRPSCYLAGLDCHTLGISGKVDEVEEKWSEFDSSTVVQLVIRHCPELEVPDIFREFDGLHGIKVYNSTIVDWGESAAITNANHPQIVSLYIARVNMTDGLLPVAFQSIDFPQKLHDIEICVTNLRELPNDLDTKWNAGATVQVEFSQLTSVPPALLRLEPSVLAVTGNPITELPSEIFEITSLITLGIGEINLNELPRSVTIVSPVLSLIFIQATSVSFFWSWADQLVAQSTMWIATASPYCTDLEKIENGTATAFSVPPTSEYSSILMDPSQESRQIILSDIYCNEFGGLLYPLAVEDFYLAISTPPELVRPE